MLFSETTLRRVFATTTGAIVGVVDDLIVDPHGPSIAALRIDGARNGDTLHWSDIIRVGPDAITVASPDVVRDAEGPHRGTTGGRAPDPGQTPARRGR